MEPLIIDTEKAKDISIEDILSQLNSSEKTGLTSEEHAKRIELYGKNEITEEKESTLLKFFKFFWGPIPWMIEAAAILSLIAKDFNDFAQNSIVGYLGIVLTEKGSNFLKGTMPVDKKTIQDAPNFGTKVSTEFINGLASVNDRMVMLLDVEKLLKLDGLDDEDES